MPLKKSRRGQRISVIFGPCLARSWLNGWGCPAPAAESVEIVHHVPAVRGVDVKMRLAVGSNRWNSRVGAWGRLCMMATTEKSDLIDAIDFIDTDVFVGVCGRVVVT